ncbi:hypothetical protein SEUCBS139899_009103 [Sporothrix eucalyptigena]
MFFRTDDHNVLVYALCDKNKTNKTNKTRPLAGLVLPVNAPSPVTVCNFVRMMCMQRPVASNAPLRPGTYFVHHATLPHSIQPAPDTAVVRPMLLGSPRPAGAVLRDALCFKHEARELIMSIHHGPNDAEMLEIEFSGRLTAKVKVDYSRK